MEDAVFSALSRVNFRVWYLLSIPVVVLLAICAVPVLFVLVLIVLIQIHNKREHPWEDHPAFVVPAPERKTLRLRDGVQITYYVVKGRTDKTVVFAAGIGCASSFKYWAAPILHRFGDDYTYIYWDYRGLFSSSAPKQLRRLAVIEHAEDLHEILVAESCASIDVLLGHSMGGMVALEFAAIHPDRVDSLVLLNTAHGKVFSSAFQPLLRLSIIAKFLHTCCMAAAMFIPEPQREHVEFITESWPWRFLWDNVRAVLHVYVHFFGSVSMHRLIGQHYLYQFLELYVLDTLRHTQHFGTFMTLFIEMDSWSIYHVLPHLQTPALVIGGIWDPILPAYQSFEMAEMLPNCKLAINYLSSHFTLLEQPGFCMHHIEEFFNRTTPGLHFKMERVAKTCEFEDEGLMR